MRALIEMLPFKVWVFLLGAAIGIPTSIYGAQWMEFKVAKQEVDCYSDMASVVTNRRPGAIDAQIDLSRAIESYYACLRGVDSNKGNLTFLREQSQRLKADQP